MIPKFRGLIQNREIIPDNPQNLRHYLSGLESKKIVLTVRKLTRPRSLQQNAYYHGVCVKLISDYTGHSPDETHEILKSLFLGKYTEVKTKNGIERVKIIRSTTSLTTVKMEEYLTNIRQWASMELNLYLPCPHEVEIEE